LGLKTAKKKKRLKTPVFLLCNLGFLGCYDRSLDRDDQTQSGSDRSQPVADQSWPFQNSILGHF